MIKRKSNQELWFRKFKGIVIASSYLCMSLPWHLDSSQALLGFHYYNKISDILNLEKGRFCSHFQPMVSWPEGLWDYKRQHIRLDVLWFTSKTSWGLEMIISWRFYPWIHLLMNLEADCAVKRWDFAVDWSLCELGDCILVPSFLLLCLLPSKSWAPFTPPCLSATLFLPTGWHCEAK